MNKNFLKTLFILTLLLISLRSFKLEPEKTVHGSRSASEYDRNVSKDYTILAVSSYCDRKCIEKWDCQITNNYLKNDKVLNVTHLMGTITRAAGYVAYDQTKNLIVVSLRGSSNAQNWISDFSFDSVAYSKCKDCKVHVGFMEDYDSIKQKLHQAVDILVKAYPTATILTTGHSMGAALSVIAGIQLKLRHDRFVEIHNIGCPRVGNPSFARFVQTKVDRINRVVHNRDIVVHLPPPEFGYHHSAHEIFFDQTMDNYVICDQTGQDKTCSNKYSPDFNAADHSFYFWDLDKIFKC